MQPLCAVMTPVATAPAMDIARCKIAPLFNNNICTRVTSNALRHNQTAARASLTATWNPAIATDAALATMPTPISVTPNASSATDANARFWTSVGCSSAIRLSQSMSGVAFCSNVVSAGTNVVPTVIARSLILFLAKYHLRCCGAVA